MTEQLKPIEMLDLICAEIYERWDKDQRSGKLLSALSGALPRYRADVTAVRQAVNSYPEMREALRPFVELGRRLGWTDLPEGHHLLDAHVLEAPADEIAPGAVYCLMVHAFNEAAKALATDREVKDAIRSELR